MGISCIDAEGLLFKNVTMILQQGPVCNIDHPTYTAGDGSFMKVEGKISGTIFLIGADLSKTKNGIALGKDVNAHAVSQK